MRIRDGVVVMGAVVVTVIVAGVVGRPRLSALMQRRGVVRVMVVASGSWQFRR